MLIAFFGLVAVEIRTRYAGPMQHQVYVSDDQLIHLQRPHPELGWIGAPEYEVDQEFPGRTLRFATNSQGFRDIEQTPDPARPHLVIIGDSFPLGWGNELADSAGPILRAALPEFQVFNAAWQGWSKDQIAWSYQLLARPLTPRVVLMMFVVDPAIDGSLPLYLGLRKPYCLLRQGHLLREGIPVRSLAPVEDNIRYFRAWEAARVTDPLAALRFCLQEFPRRYTALGQRLLPDYDWAEVDRSGLEPIDAIEAAIMEQLAAAVQRDGARLIVVPAPRRSLFANAKDPGAAMVRHLDGYRRLGLETVDIMPALGDDWQACLNPEEHLNGEGMRRIRALLVQHVRAAPQGR
jgi:hypothetical protein